MSVALTVEPSLCAILAIYRPKVFILCSQFYLFPQWTSQSKRNRFAGGCAVSAVLGFFRTSCATGG